METINRSKDVDGVFLRGTEKVCRCYDSCKKGSLVVICVFAKFLSPRPVRKVSRSLFFIAYRTPFVIVHCFINFSKRFISFVQDFIYCLYCFFFYPFFLLLLSVRLCYWSPENTVIAFQWRRLRRVNNGLIRSIQILLITNNAPNS